MTLGKFNWEETLKSFEIHKKNLQENFDHVDFDNFFKNFRENFTIKNGVEKWQVEEIKKKFEEFQKIVDEFRKKLLLKKVTLTENEKKFMKYSKASVLKK